MEIFEKLLQVFSILAQLGQLCNFDFTNLLITRYSMIMDSILFADTALVKSSELPQFASGMVFVSTLIPSCDQGIVNDAMEVCLKYLGNDLQEIKAQLPFASRSALLAIITQYLTYRAGDCPVKQLDPIIR